MIPVPSAWKQEKRKANPHQDTGGFFSDPDGTYWAWVLCSSQQNGCTFLECLRAHKHSLLHKDQPASWRVWVCKWWNMQHIQNFLFQHLHSLPRHKVTSAQILSLTDVSSLNIFQSIWKHLLALVKLTIFFVLTTSMTTLSCLPSTVLEENKPFANISWVFRSL